MSLLLLTFQCHSKTSFFHRHLIVTGTWSLEFVTAAKAPHTAGT
jgi:hypothetical protein